MSVTIRDVAKAAGVSPSTVSRVLNNKGIISEETCEKIYQAMRELKYVPNDMARSFANGSPRAIAIAINVSDAQAFANTFFNRMVFGIETAAHQSGYNLIITNATADREGLGSIERLIMGKKIDGILFPASLLQRSFLTALEDNSFPCVVLGRPRASDLEASWVDIDNEQAGQAAVNHLCSKGYRRIAFLSNGEKELFNQDRIAGYRKAIEKRQLALEESWICHTRSSLEEGRASVRQLLEGNEKPDAIICSDEKLALAAIREAKALKYDVPNDFGVLCFDDTPVTELAEPGITSVDVDTFELGRLAAENLIRQIERAEKSSWRVQLTTHIIERDSTGRKTHGKE